MKINDRVYVKQKAYMVWLGMDPIAPWYDVEEEIDYDNPGIIKGFQSPEFDSRDTIVKWTNLPWNTTIPSQFLILIDKKDPNATKELPSFPV